MIALKLVIIAENVCTMYNNNLLISIDPGGDYMFIAKNQ